MRWTEWILFACVMVLLGVIGMGVFVAHWGK
jgi:hypothetical protein